MAAGRGAYVTLLDYDHFKKVLRRIRLVSWDPLREDWGWSLQRFSSLPAMFRLSIFEIGLE